MGYTDTICIYHSVLEAQDYADTLNARIEAAEHMGRGIKFVPVKDQARAASFLVTHNHSGIDMEQLYKILWAITDYREDCFVVWVSELWDTDDPATSRPRVAQLAKRADWNDWW